MTLKIRRAAVLGAGVMGAQIAAHLAAAGVRTYLLDLPSEEKDLPGDPKIRKAIGKNTRSARAILAVENLKQLKPSPLSSPSILPNIIPGNFEDDWSVLAEADWIIEAVIERLDIKKSIHRRILEVAQPGVPVTTNTSGIPLRDICKDLPEHYQESFFGTHFFNPPRYMKLLEVIPHQDTNLTLMRDLSEWINRRLGKGIVVANDTINFIANRIGVLSSQAALKHMADLGLNIETVDALTGPLVGRPKSATIRTMDVVGLDTFAHVAHNVYDLVPDDPFHDYFVMPEWVKKLIEQGHVGQKSGNVGCYKKSKDASGKTEILAYRPQSETYESQDPTLFPWMKEAKKLPNLYKRLAFIFSQDDTGADYLWRLHRDIFSYCALLVEEIAHGKPLPIDEAMCWGYNWEAGPFQMWQGAGFQEITQRMQKDGAKLPEWITAETSFYQPVPGTEDYQLAGPATQYDVHQQQQVETPARPYDFKLPRAQNAVDKRIVFSNPSASLVDVGDGIACLTFHSKMNTLNDETISLSQRAVARVGESFRGMVIGNQGEAFSAGAYLGSVVEMIEKKDWQGLDTMIRNFQGTVQLLKFAPFPTVAAPHGLTLGGGCEVSLHTSQQVLTNDLFAGLVEVGVGLLPAGGGTKELALRAHLLAERGERGDPMPFLQTAFMLIGMGKVSTSGLHAKEMGLYPETAVISLSRDHQILRAKRLVLELDERGYAPALPVQGVKVAGDPAIQTIRMMLYNMVEGRQISPYDAFVGERVATVLCGGDVDANTPVNEQHFLDLERRLFVELCQQDKTKDRIVHMLKTGKPLRN